MPRKGRSTEEIVHALGQVEAGDKVAEVFRRLGVSEQTFSRWKKQCAGLGVAEVRELRSLRPENATLKQLVADLTLDRHIPQEIVRKRCEASRTLPLTRDPLAPEQHRQPSIAKTHAHRGELTETLP
jgi:putative transposase